jgi:hypothetical protein
LARLSTPVDNALLLVRSEHRYRCKQYLAGLRLDGERKSVEPRAGWVAGGEVCFMGSNYYSGWHINPISPGRGRKLPGRAAHGGVNAPDAPIPAESIAGVTVRTPQARLWLMANLRSSKRLPIPSLS